MSAVARPRVIGSTTFASAARSIGQPHLDELMRLDPALAEQVNARVDGAAADARIAGAKAERQALEARMSSITTALELAGTALETKLEAQHHAIAEGLTRVASALVSEVLAEEPAAVRSRLHDRIESILTNTHATEITTIRAHPGDLAVVEPLFAAHRHISMQPDDTMAPGDIRVTGDWFSAVLSPLV